jgi:hypothetical protein
VIVTVVSTGEINQFVATTNALNISGFTPKQQVSITAVQAIVVDVNLFFHYSAVQTTPTVFTTNDSPVTNPSLGVNNISCALARVNTSANAVNCSWSNGNGLKFSRLNLKLLCKNPTIPKRPFERKVTIYPSKYNPSTPFYLFNNPPVPAKCEIKMGAFYDKADNPSSLRDLKPAQEKKIFFI